MTPTATAAVTHHVHAIGILIAILLPAVNAAREAARRIVCSNRMKQIGLAIQNFHAQRDELPPSRNYDHFATWAFLILPFMEEGSLYDTWDDSLKYYYQPDDARLTPVEHYYCPSRRGGSR